MNGREEMVKLKSEYASRIPIPYGCLSIVALALAILALSSLAIGTVILK
jgi:hypothetical protein